jgi:SAM-dependent methyltransferase
VNDEVYTHGHPEAVLRSHRWRTAENSAPYLLARLVPGTSVLDVGCGPGTITADFARRVAPAPVIGIDRASEVVALARAEHHEGNLSFCTGDVYRLEDGDGTFDAVHAHQVLQHLAQPVAALTEMRRVCRPGGVVAVRDADYGAMTWWPQSDGLRRWLEVYGAVARANGGEPDAGRRLVAWAHAAGFRDVVASASVWCFTEPDDRAWWAQTWAERTTRSPLADRAVELGVATRDELSDIGAAWLAWAAHADAWFATLHGEVLATA